MQDDQRAEKLVYSCVANLTTPHDPAMRIVSVDGLDVRFSVEVEPHARSIRTTPMAT